LTVDAAALEDADDADAAGLGFDFVMAEAGLI
jgi:hypothetical protein